MHVYSLWRQGAAVLDQSASSVFQTPLRQQCQGNTPDSGLGSWLVSTGGRKRVKKNLDIWDVVLHGSIFIYSTCYSSWSRSRVQQCDLLSFSYCCLPSVHGVYEADKVRDLILNGIVSRASSSNFWWDVSNTEKEHGVTLQEGLNWNDPAVIGFAGVGLWKQLDLYLYLAVRRSRMDMSYTIKHDSWKCTTQSWSSQVLVLYMCL